MANGGSGKGKNHIEEVLGKLSASEISMLLRAIVIQTGLVVPMTGSPILHVRRRQPGIVEEQKAVGGCEVHSRDLSTGHGLECYKDVIVESYVSGAQDGP